LANSDDAHARGEPWTGYWRAGNPDTFVPDSPNLRHVETLWDRYFAQFPPGARLVDLATGGGHLVRLAASAGDRLHRRFDLHGVDLAAIADLPRAWQPAGLTTVRFQGGIDLAALPFPDRYFDGATSQFGIEYADRSAAIAEAVRVLRQGGRGLFLMHHADGSIAAAARGRLRAHRAVMGDAGAFRLANLVFEKLSRQLPPAQVMDDVRQFREAVSALARRFAEVGPESNCHAAVPFLADLARAPDRYDPQDTISRLRFVERDLGEWAARQQAMLDAALDENGIADVARILAEAGARPEEPGLCRPPSGEILGWELAFTKADGDG
jgi:SAM-dependent methyltransferase